jgi:hypothetical protein
MSTLCIFYCDTDRETAREWGTAQQPPEIPLENDENQEEEKK